jgi:uridine kinase
MINIIKNPLFILGIIFKLILISSNFQADIFFSYLNFLNNALDNPFNAWGSWQVISGESYAFPYGIVMLYSFLPFFYVAKHLHVEPMAAYYAAIFIFDFSIFFILTKFNPLKRTLIFLFYWLSPIVLFSAYGLGYNDLIPVMLLISSYYLISRQNFILAAIAFALAISAKMSMLLVLPIFVIYFYSNKNLSSQAVKFFISFLVCASCLFLPMLFIKEHWSMVINNPEIPSLWDAKIETRNHSYIFALPTLFIFLLYNIWLTKKINFDLFMIQTGIFLLGTALLVFAPAGWYLWGVPFLAYFQILYQRKSFILISIIFSLLYIFIFIPQLLLFFTKKSEFIHSLITTGFFSLGILMLYKMWRDGIKGNDYFKTSSKPITIGITGNSGVGKDFFVRNIIGLFGHNTSTHISGDNYHRWDRSKKLWKTMTHLNPNANDLNALSRDTLELLKGNSVHQKTYDHRTGLRTRIQKIKTNNILISSGLHTFFNPTLRESQDVKIYIEMAENLRTWFKTKRDTLLRGYKKVDVAISERARQQDYKKFIEPQRNYADVIFKISTERYKSKIPLTLKKIPRLYLEAQVKEGFNDYDLNRMLTGFCNLNMKIVHSKLGEMKLLRIEGDVSGKDLEFISKKLCNRAQDFLTINPGWENKLNGVMQLITLMLLEEKLLKKVSHD